MKEYEDIIHLPHHVSPHRPHMTMEARAAQFSPFAALTGHHEKIDETAHQHIEDINRPHPSDDEDWNVVEGEEGSIVDYEEDA